MSKHFLKALTSMGFRGRKSLNIYKIYTASLLLLVVVMSCKKGVTQMNIKDFDLKSIPVEMFYPDIEDIKPSTDGKYYTATCPKCGEEGRAFIYANSNFLVCNRMNNCNYSTTGLEYFREHNGFLTNKDAIVELARLSGIDIDDKAVALREQEAEGLNNRRKREVVYNFMHDQLFSNPDATLYKETFCKERNYALDTLKNTQWSYYPGSESLKDFLSTHGIEPNIIEELGLTMPSLGATYRLCTPYRDINGSITGFVFRHHELTPPDDISRWMCSRGLKKECAYNHHKYKDAKKIIVVEGYPDAEYLGALGLNVVATGQGALSDSHVDHFQQMNNTNIFLAFDKEAQADVRTVEAFKKLKDRTTANLFKLEWDECKDPDEYVRKNGIEAFKELIPKAKYYATWLAGQIIKKHDANGDVGRLGAIEEIIELVDDLRDPYATPKIMQLIEAELHVTKAEYAGKLIEYKARKDDERLIRSAQSMSSDYTRFIKGDPSPSPHEVREYLGNLSERISSVQGSEVEPLAIEPFDLTKTCSLLANAPTGLITGIMALDEAVLILPETLTVMAARPRQGKTSVALNLGLNMLKTYPDDVFVFFSLEMPVSQLFCKMISIMTNKYSYREVFDYHKNQDYPLDILQAHKAFDTEFKDRLYMIYEPSMSIGKLKAYTEAIYAKHKSIKAVFVDYMQLIRSGNTSNKMTREREVAETSIGLTQLSQSLHTAVIALASINREADKQDFMSGNRNSSPEDILKAKRPQIQQLRESGQIESDASLILGLFNPESYRMKEEEDHVFATSEENKVIPLEFNVLKNRFGEQGKVILTNFIPRTGKLLNDKTRPVTDRYGKEHDVAPEDDVDF